MKITVIFTGGTIGSIVGDDGYISPSRGYPYRLLDLYHRTYQNSPGRDRLTEFYAVEPFRILSENMNEDYMNQLIACVRNVLEENESEGVIVTHGTDTLQYTAAVLSYVFGTQCIPVVLVSSDFPLDDDRANGLINFKYAVDFIEHGYGKGVFVSYCNKGEAPVIHRGTRLLGHSPYSASVYSVRDRFYGKYEGDAYFPNKSYISGKINNFYAKTCYNSIVDIREGDNKDFTLHRNAGEIMWLRPYVGMAYPDITEETSVILHDSYHSGTIGVSGELADFVRQAGVRNIPVYITGVLGDEKSYETVRDYKNLGINVLPELSPIAAYCKLWLALGSGLDLELVMKSCIAEDFC